MIYIVVQTKLRCVSFCQLEQIVMSNTGRSLSLSRHVLIVLKGLCNVFFQEWCTLKNWMEINFECDDSRKSISENSSSKTINSAPFHAYLLINCAWPVIAHQSSARWNIVNAILRSSYLLSLFDVLPQSFVPSKIRMSLLISASLLSINNYNCTKAHSFPLPTDSDKQSRIRPLRRRACAVRHKALSMQQLWHWLRHSFLTFW